MGEQFTSRYKIGSMVNVKQKGGPEFASVEGVSFLEGDKVEYLLCYFPPDGTPVRFVMGEGFLEQSPVSNRNVSGYKGIEE